MKKFVKKLKKFNPLKYINGTKGAIALFLAVLMTPFLTIAMLLVETGRYNSAVSILDEALGVSSMSTLANYDEYLQDRWGLLGISQDIDISTTYTENIDKNSSVLGDSLTLNSIQANGMYPLSDSEILYNQIMEYSKLNAPTTLVTNFLNLSDIIGALEEFNNIGDFASLLTSGVDAVDSTITLAESADELKSIADELDTLNTSYSTKYTAFETAVNDLIDALNEPRPDESTDPDAATLYDENIATLRTNATTAQSEYSTVLGDIATKLTEYQTKMSDCSDAIASIQSDITSAASTVVSLESDVSDKEDELEAVQNEIDRLEREGYSESDSAYSAKLAERAALESELSQLQTELGINEATKDGLDNVTSSWSDSFGSYSDATIGEIATRFTQLQTTVNNLNINSITSTTTKVTPETYKSVAVAGYINSEDIDAYLDEQEEELATGSLSALIEGITSFFDSIFNLSLFYEPELSAFINQEYYETNFGGLPGEDSAEGGVMAVISDIGAILNDISSFQSNLISWKFITALKNLKNLITNIVQLIQDIAQFAIDICQNILELFSSYDRLYYSTYTTYNLTCRTDCPGGSLSFTNMSGYEMDSSSLPSQGIDSSRISVLDDLAALIDMISSAAAGTGDDITFSGAELEYVLYGSNSEISNQLYTFCALYLMRLLLDIPAVLCNPEVQSLAAASTFGYPVVMVLMILAEPLAETILLVNGGDVAFYSSTIYLTPTGLPELISELINICRLNSEQQESVKSGLVNAFGATDDDYDYNRTLYNYEHPDDSGGGDDDDSFWKDYKKGLGEFNYRDYCFFLLLLTVTKEQQMARLSNLIQMETLYHYQSEGASYTFDLRNSYTYIGVNTNISVKQMLPSLADSSLFTIDREHYRGY